MPPRGTVARQHSSFRARTAIDEAGELQRRSSIYVSAVDHQPQHSQSHPGDGTIPYDPQDQNSEPTPRRYSSTKRLLHLHDGASDPSTHARRSAHAGKNMGNTSPAAQMHGNSNDHKNHGGISSKRHGMAPRPVGGEEKLGMFSGVFVPTSLNVLSILMFLRFGFILGQGGVVGMMGMLIAAYMINLVTTLSLSAIASNGTVRGGGAYYLISRSLGPEFGGSIGVVFYLGFVFNTGMNAVGLIDCITQNFGMESGNWAQILPESHWYQYLWATIVLVVCTAICLAGSAIFARASNGLLVILLVATFSIPFSALVLSPFTDVKAGIEYTGISTKTFVENLLPKLTQGAAGSQLAGTETFQDLFGILFPATGGIFAGASMSGDLKNPSKSIPRGTLYGLATTFVAYTLVILAMAATITRQSFLDNVNIIQDTNISGLLVLAGEFASTFFSTLMGVIGSAKLLQALARDNLLPGFAIFGQGTKKGDEPTYAILITYVVAQLTMLADLNQIASFVTMTYLMTFLVMNLACFLLKIGSAPNFRPSFHFFNWQTALAGTIVSGAAMFFVDGVYATGCVGVLIIIFLIIHYTTPPKSWGDVSQSLIYHQVRKYLLRLRQEHVKFWRPQILLLVNSPRRQYKLIQFCNSMKKGSLYILGHVIVTDNFGAAVPEARRQQAAWTKYIDFSKVKAFVNIAISPGVEWGARNIVLSAGLGGMRPNIAVMGFYNLDDLHHRKPLVDIPEPQPTQEENASKPRNRKHRRDSRELLLHEELPTDTCKDEPPTSAMSYVTILEDLLLHLQINVALARGFQELEFPRPQGENSKMYIDLWPIQMSAEIATEGDNKPNVLTTNFDTYTLILQLGCILNTVPSWKKVYKLRVAVFVEYESDVDEESGRVKALLENLRIEAEVLVFWLASGNLSTYEIIINGHSPTPESEEKVEECLKGQEWWDEIQMIRGNRPTTATQDLTEVPSIFTTGPQWPDASFQQGPRNERVERFLGLRRLLKRSKHKHTISGLNKLGVSLGMRTHRLNTDVAGHHATQGSASEDSSSSSGSDSESDNGVFEDEEEDRLSQGRGSAASEADLDDFETDEEINQPPLSPAKIVRRRSHGDTMRGPPPSKKSTGEQEPKVPQPTFKKTSEDAQGTGQSATHSGPFFLDMFNPQINQENTDKKTGPLSEIKSILQGIHEGSSSRAPSIRGETTVDKNKFLDPKDPTAPASTAASRAPSERPTLSRHASMPKFSSKPVPITQVATEDGPGPSIMFTNALSPPSSRRTRLPSAYRPRDRDEPALADHISEVSEGHDQYSPAPDLPRRGSTYSTQNLPISFNDLPCRAQHLILNELMRQQSKDTAVIFTTLPSPVGGTCKSEEASINYLSDLEVLCKGCPPCMMVHSNSMTVTMNL